MIYIQSLSKSDEIGEVVFDGRVFSSFYLNNNVDVANTKVWYKYTLFQRKNVQTRNVQTRNATVVFRNCIFKGHEVKIQYVKNVVFENCVFDDVKVLHITSVKGNVIIRNCNIVSNKFSILECNNVSITSSIIQNSKKYSYQGNAEYAGFIMFSICSNILIGNTLVEWTRSSSISFYSVDRLVINDSTIESKSKKKDLSKKILQVANIPNLQMLNTVIERSDKSKIILSSIPKLDFVLLDETTSQSFLENVALDNIHVVKY